MIRLAPATASIVDGVIRMTLEREQQLVERIALLERENELLRQKLDLVLRKLFGKSSETLDPAQLELLLGEPPGKAPASLPPDGAPEEANASSAARTERKPRRERIPDHLPVVEEVLRGGQGLPRRLAAHRRAQTRQPGLPARQGLHPPSCQAGLREDRGPR